VGRMAVGQINEMEKEKTEEEGKRGAGITIY
jgi:hypothetical protein